MGTFSPFWYNLFICRVRRIVCNSIIYFPCASNKKEKTFKERAEYMIVKSIMDSFLIVLLQKWVYNNNGILLIR